MDLIADLLLIAAALGAAFYCFVLSRRLTALNSAEGGIGQAIAALSDQVARLEDTLDGSSARAEDIDQKLRETVKRAEQLDLALTATIRGQPRTPIVADPGPDAMRKDAQPASFRRRLFAESNPENDP